VYAITTLMLKKVYELIYIDPYVGWVQIFWGDSIALYDEQIKFWLLFTYNINQHISCDKKWHC